MKAKEKSKSDKNLAQVASVRASISFPTDMYRTLEKIAAQKKVSLAWVVREAAEKYIADKTPLFATHE
jgi:metal-responsive CopG/Arc/MetJ family transcriptional regulator